jgi:hypothetical protein
MKAEPFPVGTVLNGVKRFVVPIYQRAYSWMVKDELEPFWEHLATKAEERLAGHKSSFPHYMGALIVIPDGEFSFGQIQTFNVVDGQQRLTTFQIALAAFHGLARELENSPPQEDGLPPHARLAGNVATHIQALLLNAETTLQDAANERYKLQPTQFDRQLFRDLIDLDQDELRAKFPTHFYQNGNLKVGEAPLPLRAWCFFREEALEFMDRGDADEANRVKRLQALSASLLEDFRLIVITLDQNDDAQVIFETLNSRGKPLAAMDLVRNDIFHRAAKRGEDVDQLMDTRWSVFEEQFWKDETRQGRLKKQRMDFFLAHTLAAERGTEIATTELYAEYKKFVQEHPFPSVSAELELLTKYAPAYRLLARPEGDAPLARLAKSLDVFEVSTAFPAVFVIETSTAPAEEKARLYDLIASFAIRRALCGLSTNNYTRIFNRLAGMLRDQGVSVATLNIALADQSADSFRFPRDEELADAIASRKQYGSVNARRLRYLLEKLEVAARSRFDENTTLPSDLTIEHVMPDEWREFWPLPDGKSAPLDKAAPVDELMGAAIAERDTKKHTLGNLTLVNASNNPSLGRQGFAQKRKRLNESLLKLNQEIAQNDQWGEAVIAERAARLTTLAIELWPAPSRTP